MKNLAIASTLSIMLVSGYAYADNKRHDMDMGNNGSMMKSGQMNKTSMTKMMQQLDRRLRIIESKLSVVENTHVKQISADDPVYDE